MRHKRSRTRYSMSQKSKIQGAYQYLVAKDIPFDVRDIFNCFGVRSERQGYNIIREVAFTLPGHDAWHADTRDCNPKIAGNPKKRKAVHLVHDEERQIEGIMMHLESIGLEGKS